MYDVYILRCADGSLYTGIARDAEKRFHVHLSGKGAKYTKSHPPVAIIYRETLPDKSSALRREHAIKALTRVQKLQLIESAQQKPEA